MRQLTFGHDLERLCDDITLLQPGEKINIIITSENIDKIYGPILLFKWEREARNSIEGDFL